ncbi:hypothetical protein [Endozoicomonas sp. ALB115]|uniref:hypothetical protein n=1 Tax=Endozoicomonas sp. ALB115 TaxID=3403074 RepID=UPI003BB52301
MKSKKSHTKTAVWHVLVFALVVVLSFSYRNDLTYADMEPLLSILQNTSAMVFTIMGIWIAYLYPNAIIRIMQPSKVEAIFSDEDEERLKLIVGAVAVSAAVAGLLVVGAAAVPLLTKSWLYKAHPEFIRGAGLFCVLSLTYAQLFVVYIVFASNVNFIIHIGNLRAKQRLNERFPHATTPSKTALQQEKQPVEP